MPTLKEKLATLDKTATITIVDENNRLLLRGDVKFALNNLELFTIGKKGKADVVRTLNSTITIKL